MFAVTTAGGNVDVIEVADPEPASHELLVRVAAAGLNGGDRLSADPSVHERRRLRGHEMAGTVVATGSSTQRFAVGDQVMGIVPAGQSELAVIPERIAMPVPMGLTIIEAGGFPEVFCTADDAIFTQCKLGMGDRLLVTGAAGGVGTAAIQLARACGASVVGSVRDESKWHAVESLGARAVAPSDAYGLGPFDVVLELVGGDYLQDALESLAVGGRLSLTGLGAGSRAHVDFRALKPAGTIHSSSLRVRSLEEKAQVARRVEHRVLPLVSAGVVGVPVDSTFPLREAKSAYARFMKGHKFGKIILTMGN